jgi:hypothetical protein
LHEAIDAWVIWGELDANLLHAVATASWQAFEESESVVTKDLL